MAEDEDKGLLGKATDEIGKAAAKHAAKAVFDEAGRRAKQAFEGVVGSAESWVGREAATAEARREASGLPDTEAGPHWTDALAEEGEAAFKRARNDTIVDYQDGDEEDAEDAETVAARKARAREELARLKASLGRSADPLLQEAERTRTQAPPEIAPPSMDDTLDALAAEAAADAGSIVPDDEGEDEDPVMAALARARAARIAASDDPLEAELAAEMGPPVEEPAAAAPEPEEDPVMAALARARAAREAASDEPLPPEASPEEEAAPAEDPAMAALAAARAARRSAGDEIEEPEAIEDDGGMSAAERVLARAAAARGAASHQASAATDRIREQARARAAAIAEEAMNAPRGVPRLPESAAQAGLPAAPSDPFSAAEAALARARSARVDAGTTDPIEAARQAARERIARLTAEAAAEAKATPSSPFVGMDSDPMARARAALEKAAGSRGGDPLDRAANLARARAQLRAGAHRKSAEELAKEALAGYTGPNAEQLAADALAESERIATRQQEIAEEARRKAQAYGEAMRQRAEEARADVQARMAGREAWTTTAGSPEERTAAALEASAAARAKASGRRPALEAERRVELERLKRAREAREASPADQPVRKRDLLGGPSPTLVPEGGSATDVPHESDAPPDGDNTPSDAGDAPPKRRL